VKRHFHPTPRVELGQALVNVAHSCIDISDGFVADLGHILTRSQCSAEIELSTLPLSTPLKKTYRLEKTEAFALSGGEDYELCFTVPANKKAEIEKLSQSLNIPCTCIGKIVQQNNNPITFFKDGRIINYQALSGFDHFKDK
ncbi:MAG: thiamine-monophosphate kinase, partial [Haemophilus parainfluenzae]